MDAGEKMDTFDNSSLLPELSFEDLLDSSPIKKRSKIHDDDASEQYIGQKHYADETLNTPGPKKHATVQKNNSISMSMTSSTKTLTTVRTQAVKLGNSSSTFNNVNKNNGGGGNGSSKVTTVPVLLNSKNILPKTSTSIINNSTIKLTPKLVGGSTSSTNVSLAGKTAVKTSNGQIIYIHKTPSTSNMKTSATTNVVKSSALGGNNSKPVTIQVVRTADGNYVPIKTTTCGANGKNTTLTLSPTSLAGKKIITSTGGQVIIKGTIKSTDIAGTTSMSMSKTITTNTITGLKSVSKLPTSTAITGQINDLNKSKPLVVHSASGKKIIVSNQNVVKLSPKPHTISTMAGGSINTPTSGSGQIQSIQISRKGGVQYVRVLPNTKVQTTTSTTVAPTAAATKVLNTPNQPVKILNSLSQKFTVVQKGGSAKLLVTQKKDHSISVDNTECSSMASKVPKTIITVPTIKTLNDDKNNNSTTQLQQSIVKSTKPHLVSNISSNNQSLIRKHKISEINTEIQRMTTDNAEQPEIKRPTPNNRVVVVSSNNTQPKILNNSILQPGRITTASFSLPTHATNANKSAVSGRGGSTVLATQVTQNGNKLYTVLKPPVIEQKPNLKLYSVLKTNNKTTPSTAATSNKVVGGATDVKPIISTKQLLHLHQKLLQQKQYQTQQQQQPSLFIQNIKIKEEPTDSNTVPACNTETTAAQICLPPSTIVEDDNDNLDPMVGGVRRKHCNCSKSQCLKLYCDCFANGEFCQDCSCRDCFNNLENEDERQRAIKTCLERNPNAFKPKITSSRDQADMRLHNKGCNCKRSGCLKNYCECYEAKIPCSSNCKCMGCRNVEDRPDLDMDPIDPKIMATIAMGSTTDKRNHEKSQRNIGSSLSGINVKSEKITSEPLKPLSGYETLSGTVSPTLDRQQCNFITQEVIDATIQCMITQADECDKNNLPAYQTEKMVMEELGRCLVEIIDFSIRNTDNSYTQD